MAARLIACEGIDGSGKSTAARALVDALTSRGVAARLTREPTDTWLGEAVRRALREDQPPFTDALLFMADHAAHVERVNAWLQAGETVVTDRWADSTLAYQGAALASRLAQAGINDPLDWISRMEAPFNREPDLVLLFDLPVEAALDRLKTRAELEKFERGAFLEDVRANYLRLADERAHYRVINAAQTPEAVVEAALAHVLPG